MKVHIFEGNTPTAAVLPTPGKLFRPNLPKNSAAGEKVRPLKGSFHKYCFTNNFGVKWRKKCESNQLLEQSMSANSQGFYVKNILQKKFCHFSAIFRQIWKKFGRSSTAPPYPPPHPAPAPPA
jgi:hypothetical protein